MALYLKEPYGKGPDSRIGVDIDGQTIKTDSLKREWGDYDILQSNSNRLGSDGRGGGARGSGRGTVGGSRFLVPHNRDESGLPDKKNPMYKDESLNEDNEFKINTLDSVLGNLNNGRLRNIDKVQPNILQSKGDIVLNKDNQETSIKGILEENALNTIFFSDKNIEGLQQTIRYRIYQLSGKSIDYQSSNDLYIIMRSIMLQLGNFRVTTENIVTEIQKLNTQVIQYCTNNISSNLQQHLGYITEIGKLPVPLDKPAYENKQNYTYDISNLL